MRGVLPFVLLSYAPPPGASDGPNGATEPTNCNCYEDDNIDHMRITARYAAASGDKRVVVNGD